MPRITENLGIKLIFPFLLFFFAFPVYADYASLQSNDCTLLTEFTGPAGLERFINSSANCSPYTLVGSTTPATIQVFGKCTNGDILNPRFDVFTYDGTRGNEIGHSKIYQTGNNFPLFSCDSTNRNVDGIIKMPLGTNQSFFVAVSDASSSAPVTDLFEKGIGGFAHALIHFDIKSAPIEPSKPDPVIIVPGILGSSDKNGVWVIDPIFHTYDDLIATLKANGYAEGRDLFTLPYDWRQSNVLTALQLRDTINDVQAICNCAKVDLVAHSMGGLVARQYIQSDKYENDVDQLIFLGTPHLGAPKTYLMWEGGTIGVEFSIEDLLFNAFLRQDAIEAGFGGSRPLEMLFNYIHNSSSPLLSLQELLPIYNYLKDFDTDIIRNYPAGHPQNQFLENLNAASSLKSLEQSGVKVSNLFSDSQNDTINFIKVKNDSSLLPLWEHGIPKVLEKIGGDGTVPSISSLGLNTANSTNLKVSGEHKNLPSSTSSEIVKILTSKLPITIIHTPPIKKIISFFALSPIDVLITAPDGKRIGKNFATGQDINEIPGAFYSGFNTPNENLFIPNPLDGDYVITTRGTGNGSYEVLTDYIREESTGEATSTTASFAANIAIGLEEQLRLNFSSANPEDAVITPIDTRAPITTAAVSGASGINGWFVSDATVILSAKDNDGGTGVFKTEYSLDNGVSWRVYPGPILVDGEGINKLLYRSQDFAGNIEEPKFLEIKIDKTSPEAKIYFDENSKTLKVEGADNLSQTQVLKTDKVFTIQDEAGHTLKLNFNKLQQEGKEIKVEMNSLQYDGNQIIPINNAELKFKWSADRKSGQIKDLEQKIEVENKFEIKAKFSKEKDRTKIKVTIGTKNNKQKDEKTLPGLQIIKLTTKSGELNFEF